MIFALLTAIAIAAGAAYWLAAGRAAPARAPVAGPAAKAGGRYSGVEIQSRGSACRAAQALHGHRFLSKDAPALPLQGCTLEQCSCTFSKLKDRRTDGRRLDYGALNASMLLAMNRRNKKDRRRAAAAPQRS